ncbi:hypothetical protein IW150_004559 [Coemansia sp. RSA 2607]|nr:hypothetical protein IW150_004559 [Coemansia sp. RSA 2607]
MQTDNRVKKSEHRQAWSPYPAHRLTLWALPPAAQPSQPSTLDSLTTLRAKQQRLQRWRISRDFHTNASSSATTPRRTNTAEVLATHRLSFANQTITHLTIPPPSAEYFAQLVELRMPQNQLRTLPRALFMLRQLEILNLERNLLDEHSADPSWWPGLVHLRVLFLADNLFTCLPQSLALMDRLFYLDVSDCSRLACLPAEVLASKSLGTLAANRCSLEMTDKFISHPGQLPPPPLVVHKGAPRLVDLCVQSVYLATHSSAGNRMHRVCEEMRRNPGDFFVSALLLRALDNVDSLLACSVCGMPVFCPGRAVLRTAENWPLPLAWQCCSQRCCEKAKTLTFKSTLFDK